MGKWGKTLDWTSIEPSNSALTRSWADNLKFEEGVVGFQKPGEGGFVCI